jgi:type 2 lantibiotic biosynthesis protein LanM
VAEGLQNAALTLEEIHPFLAGLVPPTPEAVERGRRRVAKWRDASLLSTGRAFEEFLRHHGLSEEDLVLLMASLSAKSQTLTHIRREGPVAKPVELRDSPPTQVFGRPVSAPLIEYFAERVRAASRELELRTRRWKPTRAALSTLKAVLERRLLRIASRTLALEMGAAGLRGWLTSSTSEGRFSQFVDLLSDRSYVAALQSEYPWLFRVSEETCSSWLAESCDLLARINRDWDAIRRTFESQCGEAEVLAITEAGDRHGGRRVLIVTFAGGFRLVYKPRSLAVDQHFQILVSWLNARGQEPPLPLLRVVDRKTHGWSDFVLAAECSSRSDVAAFYKRQGAWLAVTHLLGATDLHFENVVAAGEFPYLVDIETLFHPRFVAPASKDDADALAAEFLQESVLSTALLPDLLLSPATLTDTSAIGASPEGLAELRSLGYMDEGKDSMRAAQVPYVSAAPRHWPVLSGEAVGPERFGHEIEEGYSATYRNLVRSRSELIADNGPIRAFFADDIRVIARSTAEYTALLEDGLHPRFMSNGLERSLLFGQVWSAAEGRPHLRPLIPSEFRQLQKDDVPVFTSTPSSLDVTTGDGEILKGVLARTGCDVVLDRIAGLGHESLIRQKRLLVAALERVGAPRERCASPVLDTPSLASLAAGIASSVEEAVVLSSTGASWFTLGHGDLSGRGGVLEVVGSDLYDGLSGIALFLGYFGALHRPELLELGLRGLRTLQRRIKDGGLPNEIGGFVGIGGYIYSLSHLGSLAGERSLLMLAESLVGEVRSRIPQDKRLDITSGGAGCILALLSLHAVARKSSALDAAIECGDHLLSRAARNQAGDGDWPDLSTKRGFAHGISGVAYALKALAAVTGEARISQTADSAIRNERALIDGHAWTDPNSEHNRGQATWCHGAPGIGLARLGILRLRRCEALVEDARACVSVTRGALDQPQDVLCHGNFGNLEVLVTARSVLADGACQDLEPNVARLLRRVSEEGLRVDGTATFQSLALMTGLSGIGLQALRLAMPDRVPSALLLDGPYPSSKWQVEGSL